MPTGAGERAMEIELSKPYAEATAFKNLNLKHFMLNKKILQRILSIRSESQMALGQWPVWNFWQLSISE